MRSVFIQRHMQGKVFNTMSTIQSDHIIEEMLTKKRLDDNQRAAIYSDVNTVVSAGAGSGKTTVLSYRFLRLILEEKSHVDQILTLTFTKKAAAEMHERIHSMLLEYRSNPVIARELEALDRAQIATLDSFCTQIVRSDCRRYGIAPDFRQDEDDAREIASSSALSFIYTHMHEPPMRHLLSVHSFSRLYEEIMIPLAAYHMCPSRPIDFSAACDQQMAHLRGQLREMNGEMSSIAAFILDLPSGSKSVIGAQASMEMLVEEVISHVSAGQYNEAYLHTSQVKLPRAPGRVKAEELVLLKSNVIRLKELWPEYKLALYMIVHADMIRRVYAMFDEFQQVYLKSKRAAGILTFSDVAVMAVDILLQNTELRTYYKERFTHIMIDEFQDNNDLQRQLIYLLAERRDLLLDRVPNADELEPAKLFFVGDEKQSIYRFRGADVSVFKALKQELTSCGGLSLSLQTNYRSEPGLINVFNAIFPRIMEYPEYDFEAVFEPLKVRDAVKGIRPQIHLYIKNKAMSDGGETRDDGDEAIPDNDENVHDNDAEAWFVAQRIREMVSSGKMLIFDAEERRNRSLEYRDIAILMQTLSNQMRFERALRSFGIPFTTQTVRALFLEAPINDIYQILQLAVYPHDRHAFAALLRSPFVQLGDDMILSLFTRLQSGDQLEAFDPVLDEVFCRDRDRESAYDAELDESFRRYKQAEALYREIIRLADSSSIAELIEYLWYRSGYRFFILRSPQQHRYLEYYDYLRELALLSDRRGETLSEFLDFIRRRLGSNERIPDLDVLKEQNDGVQLMTIHKSKGLEFPVVFVVNTGNRGRAQHEPLFLFPEGAEGPVINCLERIQLAGSTRLSNYFFLRAKESMDMQRLAELKRLLYVAMTRAKTHLILSGCHRPPGKDRSETDFKNLLELVLYGFTLDPSDPLGSPDSQQLLPQAEGVTVQACTIENYTERQLQLMRQRTASVYDPSVTPGLYEQAPALVYRTSARTMGVTDYAAPDEDESLQESALKLPPLASDTIITGRLVPLFGTFCHLLIEAAVKGMLSEPDPPDEFLDLSDSDRETVIADARMLSRRFLESSFFQRISSDKGMRIESEVPFMLRMDDEDIILRGKIDMMIESSDDVYVIDFKTDSWKMPDAHRAQLDIYTEAAEDFTGKRAHGMIWYLRDEEQKAWKL